MKNPIIVITGVVIILGIIVGALIVALIYLRRRKQIVDSLIRINNVVGCFATVEVPLKLNSPGKVRVRLKGSVVDFVAITDEIHEFSQGDSVVIVRIEGNKVWVVSV